MMASVVNSAICASWATISGDASDRVSRNSRAQLIGETLRSAGAFVGKFGGGGHNHSPVPE